MPCQDESQECLKARDDYNQANADYLDAESKINQHKSNRNGAGTAAGAGLGLAAAAALASNPVGWVIGVGLIGAAIFGGFTIGAAHRLKQWRKECHDAVARMNDAYKRADKHCQDKECVPPRPTQKCS